MHVPCSSKKMGIADSFTQLAALCAEEVVPTGVPCCGAPFIYFLKLLVASIVSSRIASTSSCAVFSCASLHCSGGFSREMEGCMLPVIVRGLPLVKENT